jgi:FKBP-type peptidyl-prolyl cis-trans isomerase SlyD
MQVEKNAVVAIDYTLTDGDGQVLDTSEGRGPLAYLHGAGNIIPGLEKALEGKGEGEKVNVSVPPEEGYGQRDESLIQAVPKKMFAETAEPEPGMQFQAQGPDGARVLTILKVEDEQVTVDANHPLAGQELNFDVAVVNVREASEEELEHGHVHEPGEDEES